VSTKYLRRQNVSADKISVRSLEASPYCFGLAESAAADFSQTLADVLLLLLDLAKILLLPGGVEVSMCRCPVTGSSQLAGLYRGL
jgi:hypothetical protein